MISLSADIRQKLVTDLENSLNLINLYHHYDRQGLLIELGPNKLMIISYHTNLLDPIYYTIYCDIYNDSSTSGKFHTTSKIIDHNVISIKQSDNIVVDGREKIIMI